MHVLFYSPYFSYKGGIERVLSYLATHLSMEKKYKISILTEDVPSTREYYSFPVDVKVYYRSFTPFNPAAEKSMRKLIDHIQPDVVVAMGSSRFLYKVPRALVDSSYPLVLSEHNTDDIIARNFYGSMDFLNSIRRMADYNHVLFPEFALSMPPSIADNVRAIPNPIFPSSYAANVSTKPGENRIVCLGRYDFDQKRPDMLLKSFVLIKDKYPNWNVHYYGSDWKGNKAILEAMVIKEKLEDRFYLHDAIDDVDAVLSEASIFAFPSKYEGFGLVAGEALSVGLPVVAFGDCKGVNQLVHDGVNGVLARGLNNPQDFAVALERLLSDEELRLEMARRAKLSIVDFAPQKFFDSWNQLLIEAAALKGNNRLFSLTDMEKDYVRLVVSGYLFDINQKKKNTVHTPKSITEFKQKLKNANLYGVAKVLYKIASKLLFRKK